MKKSLALLIVLYPLLIFNQTVENINTVIKDTTGIVYFDITGNSITKYTIIIYSITDSETKVITHARGDVGNGISSGYGKKIVVNLKSEGLLSCEDLRFKVIANPEDLGNIPLSLRKMIFEVHNIRRGHKNEITWPATDNSIIINLELYQNGVLIYPLAVNMINTGFFQWETPNQIEIGDYYQYKIVEVNNRSNYTLSNFFSIRPQITGSINSSNTMLNSLQPEDDLLSFSDSSLKGKNFHLKDFRRGHTNEIFWPAKNTSIKVSIELYREKDFIYVIASNIPNSGICEWKTSRLLEKGTGYQIKIVQVDNAKNNMLSNVFAIKPKIPTIIKVLAGVGGAFIIGSVLYYGLYYY